MHKTSGTDDKKLQTSLKKLNVQPIQAIEEVNMFKEDGNVIHFAAPKGTSSALPLAPHAKELLQLQAPTFSIPPYPSPSLLSSLQLSHPAPSFPRPSPVQKPQTNPPPLSITVHASVPSNTFAIYGNGEDKELTELVPGILNQLGPDSLASLRKLAESYQSLQKKDGAGGEGKGDGNDDDDDDIPDLVAGENFESKVE